jgi:hypothetical protein
MIRAILAALLMILLTSCGFGNPNQAVVEKAIALQINHAQAELGQLLYSDTTQPPQFSINRVKIAEQKKVTIEDLNGYQVQGTYDLTFNFPDRQVTQRKNPFTVYLQHQPDSKTWRWARPQADNTAAETQWAIEELEP